MNSRRKVVVNLKVTGQFWYKIFHIKKFYKMTAIIIRFGRDRTKEPVLE